MNGFFIEKIQKLRSGIPEYLKDNPCSKLDGKFGRSRTNKFTFHTVSETEISRAISDLRSKHSSGIDGLSTKMLKQISPVITTPLTYVINTAIASGSFPEIWKHSKITAIHKRGDPTLAANYRPVSCLPAASKVLEKILLKQLQSYFERNNLLPNQQHGFRPGRSCITALVSMITMNEFYKVCSRTSQRGRGLRGFEG